MRYRERGGGRRRLERGTDRQRGMEGREQSEEEMCREEGMEGNSDRHR